MRVKLTWENIKRHKPIKKLFSYGLLLMLICFIIFPNSFYYSIMIVFGRSTSNPSRAAGHIGENGGIFFIRWGLNSWNHKVRELMISTAIESYLKKYGGTDEIWDVIIKEVKRDNIEKKLDGGHIRDLHTYIYGYIDYDSKIKKTRTYSWFSDEKVAWANIHLFNRPPEYRPWIKPGETWVNGVRENEPDCPEQENRDLPK